MDYVLDRFLSRNWSGLAIAVVMGAVAALILALGGTRAGWLAIVLLTLGGALGIVSVVLAAAAVRHLFLLARWRKRYPPPGKRVDVGGYSLHYMAAGEGSPTVVWIPGGHAQGLALNHLHERAAKFTRSIIFDRPGSGWSDTGPLPRTMLREAEELETMLRHAGEKGPFVLAPHSLGGALAAVFVDRYPSQVAGLVSMDTTTADSVAFAQFVGRRRRVTGVGLRYVLADAFGWTWGRPKWQSAHDRALYKELEPVSDAMLGGDAQPRAAMAFRAAMSALEKQPLGMPKGEGILGDVPIFAIVPRRMPFETVAQLKLLIPKVPDYAAGNFLRMYRDSQYSTARFSKRGEVRLAPEGATHLMPHEAPDFIIAQVMEMVERTRASQLEDT